MADEGARESKKTARRRSIKRARVRRRELVVVFSPDAEAVGRRLPLEGMTWVLGRETEGQERFEDELISRKHCRIAPSEDPSIYTIEDLGGSNGTFLDGDRVTEVLPLASQQVISIGETLIVVDEEPDPEAMPASPAADPELIPEVRGISLAAQRLRAALATVAETRGTVLLLGPTGAGKEVAARAVHRASKRAGELVPVNCAAIPAEMAEAQFFGYRKGAFTGAVSDHDGYFVQADRGTLFLDEVGDLPAPLQAKLLRVLEDATVLPLGGAGPVKVDLRVVAATNIALDQVVFRRDLLARLGDWVLRLPPLAERRADVLTLWDHFLMIERTGSGPPPRYTAELAEALLLHSWPMNVRELLKLARRLVSLAEGSASLDLDILPAQWQAPILARFEEDEEAGELGEDGPSRLELEDALRAAKGNVKLAAEQKGWHRTQLYRWLRRNGIPPTKFR